MNVLITGAARGLGLALCETYRKRGDTVWAGVRDRNRCEALDRLAGREAGLTVLPMDVTDGEQLEAASRLCGTLDVVISNAGVLFPSDHTRPITDPDMEDFKRALEVNVLGAARVIHAFAPRVRDGGWFVTITSEGGSMRGEGTIFPAYTVSKAAENRLVATFRNTEKRLRVYAVHPGRMNTEMGRRFSQIEPQEAARGICAITCGETAIAPQAEWFIDYLGQPMEM